MSPIVSALATASTRARPARRSCWAALTASGVASTAGELQPGAAGLAAPVRGVPGLEASVGMFVSLHDIDAATVEPLVVEAARAVAEALT